MLTLYDYLPSQNAWKIRLLLNHRQRPYKQKFISIFEGEGHQSGYRKINPTGAVPAIMLDDGRVVAESNAILVYLATNTEYYPTSALLQAQVLQWLFFESDYVQSSVATLRHWKLTDKDKFRPKEVLESLHAASNRVLNTLNNTLGNQPFLTGSKYTIADISVFAYIHLSADAGVWLDGYPNVLRWIESVREQPRFLEEMFPYSIDEYSGREL